MDVDVGMDLDGEAGNRTSSAGIPDSESGPNPEAIPAPDSPSPSVQLPPRRGLSERYPDWEFSFEKKCEPSHAPVADRTEYDEMTWDHLHDQCSPRGFRQKESKTVLKPRLNAMGAAEDKRNLKGTVAQNAPVCSRGIRERAPGGGVIDWDISTHSSGNTQADGGRKRAPVRGVQVPDIPAQ